MLQAQVLNRSAAIDREEFLYLIQPVLHSAQRLAHGMLRSPTEAEDVVQEAALKAWAKIGTFQAGTDFKSWFLKIVANAIFTGTNPTCVVVTDGVDYRCTLAHAPTVETVPSYLGSKQLLNGPDSTITGGCIGTSADGLHWECYIGDAAVQHGILVKSMLGQPVSGPSHG